MTKPSIIGVSGRYSSVANSARSPWAKSTGVVCVWNPKIEKKPNYELEKIQFKTLIFFTI